MEYLSNLGKEERDEYKDLYYWIQENKNKREIDTNNYKEKFILYFNKELTKKQFNYHNLELTEENIINQSEIMLSNKDLRLMAKGKSVKELDIDYLIEGDMYYVQKEFVDKYNRYQYLIEKNTNLSK